MKSVWGIVASLCFLASCTTQYSIHWEQVAKERQVKQEQAKAVVAFDAEDLKPFPYEMVAGPDKAIAKRILDAMGNAKDRIDLNVYLLTRQDFVDALIAAHKRRVKVRVILEKTVYKMPKANDAVFQKLLSAGIPVVWADEKRFNFDHAKYLVIDDQAVISTGNFTKSSFEKNREFFLFSNDVELRNSLVALFDADFGNVSPGVVPDRLYVSPIDARPKIEQLLHGAVSSIYFYADSLSDDRILDILEQKHAEWLDVKICLSMEKWEASDSALAKRLAAAKIPFTQASGPYVHAKSLLVDRKILAMGSLNFTQNSFDNNREVGILLKDPPFLATYLSIFRKDCAFP